MSKQLLVYLSALITLNGFSAELPPLKMETEEDQLLVDWITPYWNGLPVDHPLVALCHPNNELIVDDLSGTAFVRHCIGSSSRVLVPNKISLDEYNDILVMLRNAPRKPELSNKAEIITAFEKQGAGKAILPDVLMQTKQDKIMYEWVAPFWAELPEDHPITEACSGKNYNGKTLTATAWAGCVYNAPMHLEVTRQITSEEAAAMKEAIGKRPNY